MTLLEKYFIRLVEAELREPIPLNGIEAMLKVSISTAKAMVDMVQSEQRARDIKDRASCLPDVHIMATAETSARQLPIPEVKTTISHLEATMLSDLLRYPNVELVAHEMVPLADAGLVQVSAGRWHISDAGLAALALGTGLRLIMSDGPKYGEDVLVFGFIDGVWCSAISSRDDRPYRLWYLHKRGVGFSWAKFWMSMPEAPEWAKARGDSAS